MRDAKYEFGIIVSFIFLRVKGLFEFVLKDVL